MRHQAMAQILNTSKAVDVDFFASEIARHPTYIDSFYPVFHVLTITFATSAVLNIMRSGSATYTAALNSGIPLNANCEYEFRIKMRGDDTYNVQYTGIAGPMNVTCDIIETQEVGGA